MLKHLQGRPPGCLRVGAQGIQAGVLGTVFVQPEEEISEGRPHFCLHLSTVFEDISRDLEGF